MKRKLVSLAIVMLIATSLCVPMASATTVVDPGTGAESPVTLNLNAALFKVTVPTGLPVDVDSSGIVTTASNAKIVNESHGPALVSEVSVVGVSPWEVGDYDDDMSKLPAGTQIVGYDLNGSKTTGDGPIDIIKGGWPVISGESELHIVYNAKIPTQINSTNDTSVAKVVFTVGWDLDDSAKVSGVTLNHTTADLEVGETIQLTATAQYRMGTAWISDNPNIASVDSNGLVTTVGPGVANIKATIADKEATCVVIVKELTGIVLDQYTADLNVGETVKLTATSQWRSSITWSSDSPTIASVDSTGIVTAVGSGVTNIRASQGNKEAVCVVTVKELIGIEISQTTAELEVGETLQLTANAKYRSSILWSSDNPGIVSVDDSGLITAVSYGNTTIRASFGGKEVTCAVTSKELTGISISQTTAKLNSGNVLQLTASAVYRSTIVWSSDDSNIASVSDNGLVGAKGFGTTNIRASFGGKEAVCVVTVAPILEDFYKYTDDPSTGGYKVALSSGFKIALDSASSKYRGWSIGSPLPNPGSMYRSTPVTSMHSMFYRSQATTLDLSDFDTSNVTTMFSMFSNSSVTTLDVSSFDTSKVTDMYSMFAYSLANPLDLSNFNTSSVTRMDSMFNDASATTLDLSSFDTSKVVDMNAMFAGSKATTLDLSNFNTSNVTKMSTMFSDSSATTIDLSSFDTSKITSMAIMFSESSVTTLDLSNFNTSNVTTMASMFKNAKITNLNISHFDLFKVTYLGDMFTGVKAQVDSGSYDNALRYQKDGGASLDVIFNYFG